MQNCHQKPRPAALNLLKINVSSCSSKSESDDDFTLSDVSQNSANDILTESVYSYISSDELESFLISKIQNFVIIDLRHSRFYEFHRIKTAVNYNCSSSLMCRRSIVKWRKHLNNRKYELIVVYDDDEIVKEKHELDFRFIASISNHGTEIKILKGGYSDFYRRYENEWIDVGVSKHKLSLYANSPTHKDSNSSDVYMATLSEVIPQFLYIGNEMDAKDKNALKTNGITDIINVTSAVPFYFEKKFRYYRLPASDSDTQDISQFFPEAYKILCDVKMRGGRVLIHCWAGVSRSVTIAMMYIMKTRQLDVLDALDFVKQQRPIADPNFNFLGQLAQIKLSE